MKILFLAPQPFFSARGTPINVRNVLEVLGGCGHRIDLLTYHVGDDVPVKNVAICRIPRVPGVRHVPIGFSPVKIPLDAAMFAKAFCMLAGGGYDCVHAVEESAFIAYFLKKLFKIPYVYDMDSAIPDQLRYAGKPGCRLLLGIADKLERMALDNAVAALTVCSALSRRAGEISPGTAVFQAEDCPLQVEGGPSGLSRGGLGMARDDIVVMYTGNLEPYQGVEMLVESFRHVLGRCPSARLVIAGGEPVRIAGLRRIAGELGIERAVYFAGAVPAEEVASLLQEADILASPRLKGENTPLKIYEYLASGRPVVATNLPMHTQVLCAEVAVMAEAEPRSFAGGILKLIDNPGLRSRLGGRGKELAEKEYSFAVFGEKIKNLYVFIEGKIREAKS